MRVGGWAWGGDSIPESIGPASGKLESREQTGFEVKPISTNQNELGVSDRKLGGNYSTSN